MFRVKSIDYIRQKIKSVGLILDKREVFSSLVVLLTAIAAFYLGRLSLIDEMRRPVTIEQFSLEKPEEKPLLGTKKEGSIAAETSATLQNQAQQATSTPRTVGKYVASKTSNKFHLPECPGAKKISDSNKIWFLSREEAERAGYVPAGNCKGM